MRVVVVGATGRLGARVVADAAGRGHEVRAFSRSVRQDQLPAGATAWPGDALSAADVDAVMAGADAVIVALSMVRTSDFPWARITTPRDLHSRAAPLLTAAAARHKVGRYVMVSAHGVGPSAPRAGLMFLGLVHASNIGVAYDDLGRAEKIVQATSLGWTILRPTRLTTGAPTGLWDVKPDLVTTSLSSIPRDDVATLLVELALGRRFVQEAVSVTGV
jgi:putative NADH-flavin reductase